MSITLGMIENAALAQGYFLNMEELSQEQLTVLAESNVDSDILCYMISEGFSWEQCLEIWDGKLQKVDYTLYAKKEFDANQMEVLKDGLFDRRDITKALDPELSWLEMEQIIKTAPRILS